MHMKKTIRIALLALVLSCPASLLAAELSAPTRIESVIVRDDLGVVRLEVLVSNPVSNPANCSNDTYIDIRLDAPNRSAVEQRELLNLINLSFVTRRAVRFYLLDANDPDNCSTVAATSTIRVAVGIQAEF